MRGEGGLKAARGGTWRRGHCDAKRPRAVDWIFTSRRAGITRYVEDRGRLVRKTSDHPMVVAGVRISSRMFPRSRG